MALSGSRMAGVGAAIAVLASVSSPTSAAPGGALFARGDAAATAVIPAQVGIYFGYGRPYYGPYYRPYGPYYRPYGYVPPPPPPPPVTYYETRPYVVRPAYPPGDPDAIARCASRFRSFNARTGTYITYDGEERLCPYLR